jgi:hypothetical protein
LPQSSNEPVFGEKLPEGGDPSGGPIFGAPIAQQEGRAIAATKPSVIKGLARGATSALPDQAMFLSDVPIVAGLAGGALEGARRLIDNVFDLQFPGEKKMTAKEIGHSMYTEAWHQLVFSGVAKAFGHAVAGIRNVAVSKVAQAGQRALENPEAARALEIAETKKIPLSHAEITQGTMPKLIQRVATSQPLSKDIAVAAEKKTTDRVISLLDEIRAPLGALKEGQATGEMVQDVLTKGEENFSNAARTLYKTNRDVASQAKITIPRKGMMPVVDDIEKEVNDFQEYFHKIGNLDPRMENAIESIRGDIAEARSVGPTFVDKSGKPLIEKTTAKKTSPPEIPWHIADNFRQWLNDAIDANMPGTSMAAAKRIQKSVTELMEGAANKAGGGVLSSWKEARSFWEKGKSIFEDSLYRSVVTSAPEAVAESIGPRESTKLSKVLEVMRDPRMSGGIEGSKKAEDALRLRWVAHHITGGDEPTRMSIDLMQDNLKKMTPEFARTMFGGSKEAETYLKDLRDIAFVMQKGRKVVNPGIAGTLAEQHTASMMFRSAMSMALMRFKSIPFMISTQMTGPVLAKIAFDPAATKLLLEGAYMAEKTPSKAVSLMFRSIDLVMKEGKLYRQFQDSKTAAAEPKE